MPLTSFVVLAALAAPAAAAAPPREAAAARDAREVCAVRVSAPPLDPPRQAGVPSFSATHVLDLELRTHMRRSDAATLYLRVYTPHGHLYQTFTTTLERAVPGQPRPPAIARLLVAGTAITTNGLYGRWRAEPWLGGDAAACGAGRDFVITE
jgi:hypothetical protein